MYWRGFVPALCILLAFSIYSTYFFSKMPLETSRYVVTCRYKHEAHFNHIVKLKPSILYDNRTTLQPGEIAYLNLVEQVTVILKYKFTCNKPIDSIFIKYSVDGVLEAENGWRKAFTLTPEKDMDETAFKETYIVDINGLMDLIRRIEEETGAYASKYNYRIVAHIYVEASTEAGSIAEKYEPEITISIIGGRGKRLEFSNPNLSRSGSLGRYEKRENNWSFYWLKTTVRNMRLISYAMTVLSSTCLGLVVFKALRATPTSPVRRIMKKYGSRIVDSTGHSTKRVRREKVSVKTFEDLLKVSEEAVKPIIHKELQVKRKSSQRKIHVFYVLDGDVRYEYTLEEEEAEQERTKPKPVESKPLVRVECPYTTSKGKKCGKLVFGRSETDAYKKLEAHVAKKHPDKLEEFRESLKKLSVLDTKQEA